MTEPMIRIEGLGKKYLLRHQAGGQKYRALRDTIADSGRGLLRMLRGGNRPSQASSSTEDFWALKDVNFNVPEGSVVGIIGRNGAGKSTLLKVLSRITEPTTGRVVLNGRVSSLLEVGTGFHPELTGRENVYLNGSILGMTRAEITRKFDEIVAFAEVERFLDTPVKRYSSGMYVRLAFAVAAHLEPEILIVDEVLAVGDASFQKKCLGKMGEVAKGGRTVLFVSHNMGTVSSLCETVVWLQKGQVHRSGAARPLVAEYTSEYSQAAAAVMDLSGVKRPYPHFGDTIRFNRLEWRTPLPLVYGQPAIVRFEIEADRRVDEVSVGIGFSHGDGSRVLTFESDGCIEKTFVGPGSKWIYDLEIPKLPLTPDLYGIDLGIRSGEKTLMDGFQRVADVEVVGGEDCPPHVLEHSGLGVRMNGNWSHASIDFPEPNSPA